MVDRQRGSQALRPWSDGDEPGDGERLHLSGVVARRTVEPQGRALGSVARVLALLVVVLGASRILVLLGVWDFQFDQNLFHDKLMFADFGRPNRMAPNTALNLVLPGGSIPGAG